MIECHCEDLSMTSVVEDFMSIFTSNENVKNILGSEGVEMIANMEWWKYGIFYIGGVMTLFYFFLL